MKKGKGWSAVLLIFILLAGLSLLLYPTISNYWNSFHQSKVIDSYTLAVTGMDDDETDRLWNEAVAYNEETASRGNPYTRTASQEARYENILNVGGSSVMGYIEIPSIEVYLPIYHGTSEEVLQVGVGHLEWTSLPVGGESSHTVLSGHRGLPSAKLFSNLNELVPGDIFMLNVLNETLTYEVDQVLTVLPEDASPLTVTPGEDYCTLVTCTPYGINTHRLLVRGHRIPNIEEKKTIRVTADAMLIKPIIVTPIVAVPLLIFFMTWLIISDRRRKK